MNSSLIQTTQKYINLLSPIVADKAYQGITCIAQEVRAGQAYVAITGAKHDGNTFIPDAIARGAKWIITDQTQQQLASTTPMLSAHATTELPASIITVENPRLALSALASLSYPLQAPYIAAVTGTKGKTSVAYFAAQLLAMIMGKAAYIGTMGVHLLSRNTSKPFHIDIEILPITSSLTTPDPIVLHKTLSLLAERHFMFVVLEASSHALVQHRLDFVRITSAAFTNLGHDHLDYHHTAAAYFSAKQSLFRFPLLKYAILNADIPEYDSLRAVATHNHSFVLDYGSNACCYRLQQFDNQHNLFTWSGIEHAMRHNLSLLHSHNIAASILLAHAFGCQMEQIALALPHLQQAPGRMEKVTVYNDASIYIDFAHTPESLTTILSLLRPKDAIGRLIVVLGCGGERDKTKRPIMGEIAARLADIVVITDDNPRNEDAGTIRQEVMQGCPRAINIGDRRAAINHALSLLQPRDVLVVAGKGNETYQIIGDDRIPYSDRESILCAVDSLL